jgi:deoxynucleotide monophosphate kinase-like protein
MLIGLLGYAQSGKDSAAQTLVEEGFTRFAFADVMRDMLYALNPIVIPVDPDWGSDSSRRVRDLVEERGWDNAKTDVAEIRQLMQRLGTEAGRNILGENIWVDTTMAKARGYENVVITDVRFPNEANAITTAGGELWRIVRPGIGPVNNHPSETALDGYATRIDLENDGDLLQLHGRVLRWLESAKARERIGIKA